MSSRVSALRSVAPDESRCAARSAHRRRRRSRRAPAVLAALLLTLAAPAAASAHGPVAPIASSYLARIGSVPPGLRAEVIDGDQRLLLSAPAAATVIVLDNRGAPYLRFSPAGVAVNLESALYYENQTPVALAPPPGLTAATAPRWRMVTAGHSYQWHEGRLHALAGVALAANTATVGQFSVPLRIDGRPAAVTGVLVHAGRPPLVWFWPVIVLLACLPALWRLHRQGLDRRLTAVLLAAGLIAITAGAAALELHGRPGVSAYQLFKLTVVAGLCAWGAWRLARGRTGSFAPFVVGAGAVWVGVELLPALRDGFVLAALPPALTRITAVLCLACGLALVVTFVRAVERETRSRA